MISKGMIAPHFCLPDQRDNLISLSNWQGMRLCIVFFHDLRALSDRAFATAFAHRMAQFQQLGVAVLAICGCDDVNGICKEEELDLMILCDRDGLVRRAYDVWKRKVVFGKEHWLSARCALIINAQGAVEQCFRRLAVEQGSEAVLDYLYRQQEKERWRKLSRRTKERLRREQKQHCTT